mgnify:FL=1|tara:strand:- start:3823 stop:4797 length:975 start_codon:yes stop_codon:yes gene_type:complete
MIDLKKIIVPIKNEMDLFEKKFKESISSDVAIIDKIMHYIVKRKGKQIRPIFVFLSAKLFGNISNSCYTAASLIELLHTATLIHDDVVDESNLRRGVFSINAVWKNKIAVLVGDFLLSKGLLLSVKNKEYKMLGIMSNAVEQMSEGELLQMEKSRKLNISETDYYKIIRKKTAALISACCESGAVASKQCDTVCEKMKLFGEYAGMAFQIKDDLFDYESNINIGKPQGIDIKDKKLTLPIIYSLNKVSYNQKKIIINTIKKDYDNDEKIVELYNIVKSCGGIEYSKKIMKEYHDKAIDILNEFENNEAKNSLTLLLKFIINRQK